MLLRSCPLRFKIARTFRQEARSGGKAVAWQIFLGFAECICHANPCPRRKSGQDNVYSGNDRSDGNSQKRIAYGNYSLIPGRERLCAKVPKEVLFPDGKLPHLKETVCGWRTKRPALCGLNARSLHMCIIERKCNLHPLPRLLPTPLYSRFNTCSISLLLYKTLPPRT